MPCDCVSQADFLASNIAVNGCPLKVPGECAYYSDSFIAGANISSGDNLNTIVKKLALYTLTSSTLSVIDAIPINGSNNPVTSNGVFDALADKQKTITLTTVGNAGPASFNSATGALNIPNYFSSGGGGSSITDFVAFP